MKKLVYIFTAAAMTLGLAGCTQEKLQPGTAGEEVDVALSVSVPGGQQPRLVPMTILLSKV